METKFNKENMIEELEILLIDSKNILEELKKHVKNEKRKTELDEIPDNQITWELGKLRGEMWMAKKLFEIYRNSFENLNQKEEEQLCYFINKFYVLLDETYWYKPFKKYRGNL